MRYGDQVVYLRGLPDPIMPNPILPDQDELVTSGFSSLFGLMIVVGIGLSVWRFAATRNMAKRRGASDADATTVALFGGETGTAVAYAVKDARPAEATEPERQSPADVEERIRSVRELESKGLITTEQAASRVEEILRDV